MMEVVKTFSISKKQIAKRYHYKNMALLEEIAAKGKSIIIVGSHHGNWEWNVSINIHTDIPSYATYTKISNKIFENKIKIISKKEFQLPQKSGSRSIIVLQKCFT